ncbi:MAG TPA: SHOCT domain-containing protein [Nakamurella sp.]
MGLFRTAAKVAVASSVHGRIQRRQQQRWAAQDAAPATPIPAQPAPAPEYGRPQFATEFPTNTGHAPAPAAPAAGVDMATKLAQLQQLGELKSTGILSEAEFEAQKSAILAQ